MPKKPTSQQLLAENAELRARLNEAEETLRAIRDGEVDALVVSGAEGENILDLKGGQEPYRIMVEAMMNDGAVMLAVDGSILYSNQRFADWVKVPSGQIVGQPLQGMLAEQHRKKFDTMLVQGAKGSVRETLTLQATDGMQIPALFSMSPLPQSEGKAISVVIADLSEVIAATETRSRLALIIESSEDAIVSTRLDGTVESWNRAAEKLYGYTAKEAIGQPIDDLIVPPEHTSEMVHELESIRLGKRSLLEDAVRLRKDGTRLDVSIKASPILDANNKVIGASINSRDITERKASELALQKKDKQLSEALSIARIGYWEYEYATDEFLFNDQYYSLHKITVADAGGYRVSSSDFASRYVHPEDTYMVGHHVRLASETSDPDYSVLTQARFLSGEGEVFWMEIRFRIQKDQHGNTVRLIGINQDITEHKQAELDLLWKTAFFEALVKTSEDGILVVDAQGRKILQNQRFNDLFSIPEDIAVDINDSPQLQFVINQVVDTKQFGDKVHHLYEHPEETSHDEFALKDGTILQRYSAPVVGSDGHSYGRIWIFHDITTSRLAELKLLESERRFSDLLGNVQLVSIMLDRDSRITYCNDYLLRLTGWKREEVMGKSWWDIFVPPDLRSMEDTFFTNLLDEQPETLHHKNDIMTRSGERRLIRWNNSVLHSATGEVTGIASIGEDITEREKAAASIKYLNRVLSMLSGINALIVHAKDREELFRETCNIATEAGGFRMAMIVILERDTMLPVSITSAGKNEELLSEIKNIMSTRAGMQKTMVAQAIREKKALISNDTQKDPRLLTGKHYAAAGVNSMIVLPLIIAGEAVGILALYASEINFFQKDEMKLLTELANDIAYAIDHIEKQERLNYLAYYDVLTGLANRSLFFDRTTQYIHSASNSGHKLAIGLIDLERFKNINDSFGRSTGDALLKQVAEWLTHEMGDANLLARFDADHFVIVLPNVKSDGNLAKLVEHLMTAFLEHRFHLNETALRIGIKDWHRIIPG